MNNQYPAIMSIIQSFPYLAFCKDENLEFTCANPAFVHYAGFKDPDYLLHKNDYQMRWANYANKYQEDDQRVLQGESMKIVEINLNKQNQPVLLQVEKKPIIVGNNKRWIFGYAKEVHFQGSVEHDQISDQAIPSPFNGLKEHEISTLYLLTLGYSASQIALKLHRSKRTIEDRIEKIKLKMRCKNK